MNSNGDISEGSALTVTLLLEKSNSISEEVLKAWEQEFLDYINSLELSRQGLRIFPNAAKSYLEERDKAIDGDFLLIFSGVLLVFVFVTLILGK